MPTVTLDGRPCEARVGETILEVARRNGVWIPTLCHHPALEPYASCRLCLVEIDRGGWGQVVTSCNYPVRRDLTVGVEAERPRRARQTRPPCRLRPRTKPGQTRSRAPSFVRFSSLLPDAGRRLCCQCSPIICARTSRA